MTATLTAEKFEAAAEILSLSRDFRVLRRFVPRDRFLETIPANAKFGVYVDVETTTLDRDVAEVMEIGVVPFLFDPDRAQIIQVVIEKLYAGFEEPKGRVDPEAVAKHGITPDMVIGQRLDDARVNALIEQSALVIAHNAEFDRPILERRLPAFAEKHWACSYREVQWESYGAVGAKLGNLIEHVCGEFYDAHRALDDCRAGIHVLAHQRDCDECDGAGDVNGLPCEACVEGVRSPFSDLLQSARLPTFRVWAIDAPFMAKEKLKARGYRWSPGDRGQPKAWFKDTKSGDDQLDETMYLEGVIGIKPRVERITAKDRYSARVA